ncbi:hypothetical protein [Wolbachia endosymbiont of Brugia malayi]|uniref:hypothetical protein n=1 Tax=Wolbachia endosymbiont of Brugia malayi TaxID=80849 RepID=UPI0002E7845F|nr:hypothetical protein [Wolbachia endosymbiont of Brugia malayi]
MFGAIGATLVAIGIMPKIAAIGMIATAVLLSGVAGNIRWCVGYLQTSSKQIL